MKKNLNLIFKILFKTKFKFSLPKKNKILIYDSHSCAFAKVIFNSLNFEIIHTRLEVINFTVLFLALFKYGFNNLSFNYRKTYFKYVSPKIIFTSIDTNMGFYLLKEKLKKYTFISVQNGMRSKKHYLDFKNIKKKIGKKIKMDYLFTLGNVDKVEIKKIFDAKIFVIGNIFNNNFKISKNNNNKTVIFIQQSSLPLKEKPSNFAEAHQKAILDQEIHLIKLTYDYCQKEKLKFIIFIKRPNTKKIIQNLTKLNNLNFSTFSSNKKIGYKALDNSRLTITPFSSLGFECISRGNKTVILPPKKAFVLNDKWFPLIKYKSRKFNIQRFFLVGKISKRKFEDHVNKVVYSPNSDWKKLALEISNNVISYDNKNKKLKNIINKILL